MYTSLSKVGLGSLAFPKELENPKATDPLTWEGFADKVDRTLPPAPPVNVDHPTFARLKPKESEIFAPA